MPSGSVKPSFIYLCAAGGDSKTLMFVQISPSEQDLGETLSSLNFATRVRGVELGPARKQIDMGELQKLKMMVSLRIINLSVSFINILLSVHMHIWQTAYIFINGISQYSGSFFFFFPLILLKLDKAKQELRSKEEALKKLEENLHNSEGKAKGKDQLCRSQQEKVSELEGRLASKTQFCRQLEKQLLELADEMKEKEEICLNLQQKVAWQIIYLLIFCHTQPTICHLTSGLYFAKGEGA